MTIAWQEQLRPGLALREIVQEATVALIRMDADRLEELARCCADLNREVQENAHQPEARSIVAELHGSEAEMQLLGRVLYESRANLTVISWLHEIRLRQAEASATALALKHGTKHSEMILRRDPERRSDYGDN